MFTNNETKLLNAPAPAFPLLVVAQRAARTNSCGSCGHRQVNVHTLLRVAVNKYKSDKNFIEHCQRLFALPTSIAGVRIVP